MIGYRSAALILLATAAITSSATGYLRLRAERDTLLARLDTATARIDVLERAAADRPICPPPPGPASDLAPGALAIYQRVMSATTPDTARRVALTLARYVEHNFAGIERTMREAKLLPPAGRLTDNQGQILYTDALDLVHAYQLRRHGGDHERLRALLIQEQNMGAEAGTIFAVWDALPPRH